MRWQQVALAMALAGLLGCENPPLARLLAKKDVPITQPQEVARAERPVAASEPAVAPQYKPQPATQAAAPDVAPPATVQPLTSLVPDDAPVAAESQPAAPPHEEVVSGLVLQINDRYITIEDILRSVATKLAALPKNITPVTFRNQVDQIIREEIRRQIGQALVLAEAQKRLEDDQKKLLDEEMVKVEREMVAEFGGGSRSTLEAEMVRQGTTLKEALDAHRAAMTVQVYLKAKLMPAIHVSREDLWGYYRLHRGEFATPQRIGIQTIGAPWRAFAESAGETLSDTERQAIRTKAREQIDQAAAALDTGADFADVARKFSKDPRAAEGGVWPVMPAGSFRDAKLEQAAVALPQGRTSGVVETDSGFYIVRAIKQEPAKTVSFEEAQEKIEETLRQDQYRKLSDAYFKQLLDGATVVQSERFAQLAADKAMEQYGVK